MKTTHNNSTDIAAAITEQEMIRDAAASAYDMQRDGTGGYRLIDMETRETAFWTAGADFGAICRFLRQSEKEADRFMSLQEAVAEMHHIDGRPDMAVQVEAITAVGELQSSAKQVLRETTDAKLREKRRSEIAGLLSALQSPGCLEVLKLTEC